MKTMLVIGCMFILSIQPMMVISMLIFSVLLYSIYMYWGVGSFWYSYMVVLVLMSGILVLFTYMMSVLPNESFESSSLILILLSVVMFTPKGFIFEEWGLGGGSLGSSKIWDNFTFFISLFMVIYLLFMMVMIVWVSMMEKGAIRIS